MNGLRLLNPGPVTLTPRVRDALAGPDLCHREPEFFDMQDRIRARLLAVYDNDGATWAPVLISGSGTSAVEAMIASLPGPNDKLLVIENGVYGERMTRMAAVHDIEHVAWHLAWGEAIDARQLAEMIRLHAPTHVAVVHHETTTGRLNDIAAIAAVCESHDISLLVDAVSSFGAESIAFTQAVAAVAATANKCLHGAPGAAFVIVRHDALASATTRALYLDLAGYAVKQAERGTPFTPGIPAFYALDAALAEHAEAGGWCARRSHYRDLADRVGDGLAGRGMAEIVPREAASCVLRSYRLPPGVSYARLHDHLKQAGFVIYAGQGALAEAIFRVSTMGDLSAADMAELLAAFDEIIAP